MGMPSSVSRHNRLRPNERIITAILCQKVFAFAWALFACGTRIR
jgi:hypothetical protein